MKGKHVEPKLGSVSFSCPRCGTLAHQTWFKLFAKQYGEDEHPTMFDPEVLVNIRNDRNMEETEKATLIRWVERINNREIFLEDSANSQYVRHLNNVLVSQCYSCKDLSLWRADTLLYPPQTLDVNPNEDLDANIKDDFTEAATILDQSPRGAVALLRLALQKLLKQLGEPGENINADIASLVQKGLDVKIQRALDVVRVVGNNAVHPGMIDFRDNRDTAVRLFGLINLIAHDRITHPREIDALYDNNLSEGQKEAISKRDTKAADNKMTPK